MSKFQLDPEYVPALSDAMVILKSPDGTEKELGRLGSFDAKSITAANGTYSIKIDDLKSGDESAANIHFRDQRTLTMRVWVRLAATLLPALSDAMVIVTDAKGSVKEIGRLGAFDANTITAANGTFSIKIDDLKSGEESAANLHFRDQRTLTMRVWVRLAATLLPALLLVISLWIQRKKFIIDECYYDQMMVEINSRKEEESSLS